MRTITLGSIGYSPAPMPENKEDFGRWIQSELNNIQIAISLLSEGHLDQVHAAPAKPRNGDIRLADGTDWNPGLGQGVYCYYNSTWNKLG